ncbi:uncharacterized protein LOC132278132 [Cornus florida]|uniref:uncharacterized protein LOC132278132 n=1 Tax=Cornus florida TaxID=4283 RepID=UPI0028987B36|nr:uncharacterized protein LOC132278132 [Cornus florida]
MKIRIITWNVRGLNDPDKRRVVKVTVRKWNAHVICLQETKLASITDDVVRSLWGSRWKMILSVGSFLEFIDPLLIVKDLFFGKNSLPWCLGGDFNSIRSPFERSTGGRWSPEMTQFSDFIDGHLLIDLPLEGATFTWSSGRDPVTLSRLDRFLNFGDWEEKFPDVTQAALVRVTSDHEPLVLDCGGMTSRRTPFRFENMWLRAEDFQGKVQSWWGEATFTGSTSYVLAKKFQILKYELKKWNKEVFGNL